MSEVVANAQAKAPVAEVAPKVVRKHLVEFIGNGVHKDSAGKLWARSHENPEIKNSRDYTDEEWNKRPDLQFMAEYGAMKHTIVEI